MSNMVRQLMDGMDMNNSSNSSSATTKKVMMHMSLYWGTDVWVLFANWPGTSVGQYVLSLIVTFLGAILVEFLAFRKLCRPNPADPVFAGFLQAFIYGVRVFFAYCVMLAVMSFNIGVLLVAVVGHGVGYWLFGTTAFCKSRKEPSDCTSKDGGQCC